MEAVYADDFQAGALSQAFQGALQRAEEKARQRRADDACCAEGVLISPPDDPYLVDAFNQDLDEDEDPAVHPRLRAATRLGRPAVGLICLGDGDTYGEPDEAATRALLDRLVSVSHPAVYRYFSARDAPRAWRANAALRHQREARFPAGRCEPDGAGFALVLEPQLGLVIETRGKDGDGVG